MGDSNYRDQQRGNRGAYQSYLNSMDASMRQKVALTAAHLLARGKVADMGMGSGTGSETLAALYPELEVVGVDVEPTMVELARARYTLPNLSFELGDIAQPVFAEASLDGILNSSVLHHVTSFNGYAAERAAAALAVQATQLSERGILLVRDFLAPEADSVLLDLPADDGDDTDDPRSCSSAQLFERFAREFRPLSEAPGFEFHPVECSELRAGWRRYSLARKHAVEFLLRKDYREDWSQEVKEEYTYFTQAEFERVYARLGLRVLTSTPIRNPWITRHRFMGRFEWRSLAGELQELPPTNYLIVGEKVPEGEGVVFREAGPADRAGFLQLSHYRHRETGKVFDLVRRPHRTLDIIPWFELDGDCFVLARASYPRPIARAESRGTRSLDGRTCAGYVVEPLLVIETDQATGTLIEETLAKQAGITPDSVEGMHSGSTYYPSPGGIQEEVRSTFVRVKPVFVQRPLENHTEFSTAGRVLAIEAQQLLRAAQVGGLPDARLELNVYDLLLSSARSCGPWIGEAIELEQASVAPPPASLEALQRQKPRRSFERADAVPGAGFLEVHSACFEELDRTGNRRATSTLEFVVPRPLSHNTVAAALLWRKGDQVWIGVDDDDLPAAQGFVGNSNLLVAPAWRLPRNVATLSSTFAWVRERLEHEYSLHTTEIWHLGGAYHPSLGMTPEVVYPIAVNVQSQRAMPERVLHWLRLEEAVAGRKALFDGHLSIVLMRAAHALGIFSP